MLRVACAFALMCVTSPYPALANPAQRDGDPRSVTQSGALPQSDPSANDQAVRGDALELARLLNPEEPMVELARRGFDQAFDQGLAGNGEVEELEREHPGFLAELRGATRDALVEDLRSDMPSIHRRYARFFSARFTPDEIAELTDFYKSPAGARIIEAKFANLDISGLVGKVAENEDAKVSAADIEAINDGATSGMWKGMTAADMKSVLLFGLRPVARKLQEAAPAIAEIETEIANEPDSGLDAAIEAASRKVYDRYGLAD
ncbi:MAG TPA: DUF2059 domain-containing protein [Sphingomicrobium sp.]|nr:DUF2059 domain-containing protein [Sphingomicrobium sp.]